MANVKQEINESMKNPRYNLVTTFIILGIFIISILTYVSVLGENHKINRVINGYFDKLRDGMYLEACESFATHFQEEQLVNDEQRLNFNFLLELSLLRQYDLIDHYDYTIEVKRSHFWIPFMSEDSVRVSVLLREKRKKGVSGPLSTSHSREFTRNLILVGREKRSWKIMRFTIADSSISDLYNDLRQHIDLNKYTKRTPNGFRLKDVAINLKTLTPIDKRLLRFSFYKIQKSLEKNKKDKGSSLTQPPL